MTTDLGLELAELEAVDTASLSPRGWTQHMARCERFRSRTEAFALRTLAAFELSSSFSLDAARTPADWLASQTRTQRRIARSRVNLARHLRSMPFTSCAFSDGAITEGHARVLAQCVANPRTADEFVQDEPYLVGVARRVTADELQQIVNQWIEYHDPDGSEPSDPKDDVVHVNRVGDRVKLDGDFGLETGLQILAAINEHTDQLYRRDQKVAAANPLDGLATRTPGNRRAEATVDLILAGAGAESNPRRREPLFNVTVDPTTFALGEEVIDRRGRPVGRRQLADGTVIPLPVLLNWRCGAEVSRAWLDAHGVMLSYGRDERYANRDLRRALAVRDGGCDVPGCDRPPEHCDAHHVIYWEDFGPTDIENLRLLCRHHHREVHADRLSIEIRNGTAVYFDALGARIPDPRHPPEVRAA